MGHMQHPAVRGDNPRAGRRKPAVSFGTFLRHIVPAPLRRLLALAATGATLFLALCGAVALATWSVSDPSITYAAGGETSNWMGYWGASFADLSMQFIGLGSIALVGVIAGWCLYTLTGRHLPSRIARFSQFAIGLCLLTAALGCLAAPQGWPLFGAVGLGGVIGDAWLAIPRAFIGTYPSGPLAAVAAVCLAAPGLYLLARSTNIHRGVPPVERRIDEPVPEPAPAEDEIGEFGMSYEDEGRDWGAFFATPIGLAYHLAYSVKAMFRARVPRRNTEPRRRMAEPTLMAHMPETGLRAAMSAVPPLDTDYFEQVDDPADDPFGTPSPPITATFGTADMMQTGYAASADIGTSYLPNEPASVSPANTAHAHLSQGVSYAPSILPRAELAGAEPAQPATPFAHEADTRPAPAPNVQKAPPPCPHQAGSHSRPSSCFLHRKVSVRTPHSPTSNWPKTPLRWKACWKISASRAPSFRSAPAPS